MSDYAPTKMWCLGWKAEGHRRKPCLVAVVSFTRAGLIHEAERQMGTTWARLRKMGAEAVPAIIGPRLTPPEKE